MLRFHEYRYYIMNEPLISDFEYDQLFKRLEKIEQTHPSLLSPDSPTQRVAKGLTKDFPTVQHLVPMLSLDNSYNETDLIDFDRKARDLTKMKEIEKWLEQFRKIWESRYDELDHVLSNIKKNKK